MKTDVLPPADQTMTPVPGVVPSCAEQLPCTSTGSRYSLLIWCGCVAAAWTAACTLDPQPIVIPVDENAPTVANASDTPGTVGEGASQPSVSGQPNNTQGGAAEEFDQVSQSEPPDKTDAPRAADAGLADAGSDGSDASDSTIGQPDAGVAAAAR